MFPALAGEFSTSLNLFSIEAGCKTDILFPCMSCDFDYCLCFFLSIPVSFHLSVLGSILFLAARNLGEAARERDVRNSWGKQWDFHNVIC